MEVMVRGQVTAGATVSRDDAALWRTVHFQVVALWHLWTEAAALITCSFYGTCGSVLKAPWRWALTHGLESDTRCNAMGKQLGLSEPTTQPQIHKHIHIHIHTLQTMENEHWVQRHTQTKCLISSDGTSNMGHVRRH